MHSFGTAVRDVRREAGLTQIEVAERAGITQGLLSKIESGKCHAGRGTVFALREALGLEPYWSATAFLEGYSAQIATDQGITHEAAYAQLMADMKRVTEEWDAMTPEQQRVKTIENFREHGIDIPAELQS